MGTTPLFCDSGARFSPCGRYRYTLWRRWEAGPALVFVMLNPSTATATANDPTVERCQRRAAAMGFAAVVVVNLFAYRATNPADMKAQPDPVGPENDAAILEAARTAGMVVCAWGNHGSHGKRSTAVVGILRKAGIRLHCLRIGKTGEPGHPLYIGYEAQPVEWDDAENNRRSLAISPSIERCQ